jgi:putative CocE/NonD family hydrolase
MNAVLFCAFCLPVFLLPFRWAVAQAEIDVAVRMRDGVELPSHVWIPGDGAHPVVLSRGYSVGGLGAGVARRFNEAGYVYMGQQCRGNGGADGTRFIPDDRDAYDCIEWISRQPWCDGNVAMWGGSYWGITAWRAVTMPHPNLKAIVPGYADPDPWRTGYRRNGAIHLKMTTQTNRAIPRREGGYSLDEWKRMLSHLPLIEMDNAILGEENQLWNDYVAHSEYDDYWKAIGMREGQRYTCVTMPVYPVAGFRDYYADGVFAAYETLRSLGVSKDVRVRVANGGHSGTPDIEQTIRWFDYHLKGVENGIEKEPPITVQMTDGEWRSFEEWPPSGTTFRPYYLSSPDGSRIGSLRPEPLGEEAPTRYTYDPSDPVPTLGANGSHESVPGLIVAGPADHRPNQARQDVLVFTTDAMDETTELIGPVEAVLYASSSARDTDFTVTLLDVHSDGRALNLTEGIVRARFRESIWAKPKLITPGVVYEYRVELLPVATCIEKGHRLRVHVSSSSWPLWDRNQNTGNAIGMDAEIVVAEQTIYHDRDRPSRLVLPIHQP